MHDWAATNLAWQLANLASQHLGEPGRSELHAAIGAGDAFAPSVTLLKRLVAANICVPLALAEDIAAWLNAHSHHEDATALRELLQTLRART